MSQMRACRQHCGRQQSCCRVSHVGGKTQNLACSYLRSSSRCESDLANVSRVWQRKHGLCDILELLLRGEEFLVVL